MKYTLKSLLTILILIIAQNGMAQKAEKTKTITIKTSAQCEMCKERIEKAMAYEKGVVSSNLEVETAELTVKYKFAKTTPEKIRIAISKVGYDADTIKAVSRAYERLPQCCQKGGMEH